MEEEEEVVVVLVVVERLRVEMARVGEKVVSVVTVMVEAATVAARAEAATGAAA
mgnify:CR=1 FL=1